MGAMGEVYHARDTRLNRMVALKILPGQLETQPEHHDRFVQEAQLASSLQHPNIVTIFDIGTDGPVTYLAMELVRGRPLDQVIPVGGLRLKDALRYAIEIADALTAAHGAGIVHRDLKPANIMVADNGHVKILDFGLATLVSRGLESGTDETVLQRVVQTNAGTILGTVAYMSPEQAEGKPVDGRSDLFSFGAILYEMVSGRRPFRADSTAGTLASILSSEPQPLTESVGGLPQSLDKLVGRCLRKDPARRAQHASDVRLALEEIQEELSSGTSTITSVLPQRRRGWMLAAGALALVALTGLGAVMLWSPRRLAPPVTFEPVPLTALPGWEEHPTFSPDGTQVAFMWEGPTEKPEVYAQVIGAPGAPLRLTNDGAAHVYPSWSPDGKSLAVWHSLGGSGDQQNANILALITPLGGPERRLLEWTGTAGRISWSPDASWIAIANQRPAERGIVLISPATGTRVDWRAIDPALAGSVEPVFAPDGKRLAYVKSTGDFTGEAYMVGVTSDGRPAGEPVRLPLDETEMHDPVWTADGLDLLLRAGDATSNGGVIRVRVDGSRPPERIATLAGAYAPAISLNGTKLAFSRGGDDADMWRVDLLHPEESKAISRSSRFDSAAAYSPDGRRIAFSSNRSGTREIWVADENGENAQPLTRLGGPVGGVPRWSPDGQHIVFDSRLHGHADVFVVPAAGGAVRRLTLEKGEDARPVWSPDGQWIYFSSDRGGRSEIWRMSPTGENATVVTRTGAVTVVTSHDGQWLYYRPAAPPFFLRRIRPDGTDDAEAVHESMPMLGFAASESGIWFLGYAGTGGSFLRRLRPGEKAFQDVVKLPFYAMGYPISISPDERYALITSADERGTDLLLIENFR